MTTTTPYRQVRAMYDETTIAVYQAYPPEIADPALAATALPEELPYPLRDAVAERVGATPYG